MAAPAAVLAAKIAVQAATSEKGKKAIGTLVLFLVGVILIPILLVTSLISCLAGWLHLDAADSPYAVAELQVADELEISNTLDIPAVKVIDLIANPDMDEDPQRIAALIAANFIKTETVGEGDKKETITLYLSKNEMEELLPLPPFSFDADKMEAFRLLYSLDFSLTENPEDGGGTPGSGSDGFYGIYPMPIESGRVTSWFGNRQGVFSGNHGAIDMRPPRHHAPIYAIADGVVVSSTAQKSYGNYVKIRHTSEDGQVFYTLCAHMSRRDVKVGETVYQGQQIGLEGGEPGVDPNPGDTTGHHLHFEVRLADGRTKVDPAIYLRGWG